jgi:hypothetical protein
MAGIVSAIFMFLYFLFEWGPRLAIWLMKKLGIYEKFKAFCDALEKMLRKIANALYSAAKAVMDWAKRLGIKCLEHVGSLLKKAGDFFDSAKNFAKDTAFAVGDWLDSIFDRFRRGVWG